MYSQYVSLLILSREIIPWAGGPRGLTHFQLYDRIQYQSERGSVYKILTLQSPSGQPTQTQEADADEKNS